MKNEFLRFYGTHNISPVRQNIDNLEMHYQRREKLYRQCGIPVIAFKDKEVLEIGPGGGVNTLALFQWGIRHIDLVEPNVKGCEDMRMLFKKYNICQDSYTMNQCTIEDYITTKKYDFIIAEGFLHGVDNRQKIINKCKSLIKDHGIIVIICSDHVCCFIELMKRLMGHVMTRDITVYDDKVDYMVKIFEPQLSKLSGVSRLAKDWVEDQMLNPAIYNFDFSLSEAIDYFGVEYDVMGASPNMFTDYSWYKDLGYDYKDDYNKQFASQRLSLLMAGMPEKVMPIERVKDLVERFEKINDLAMQYEDTFEEQYLSEILQCIHNMKKQLLVLGNDFMQVYGEIEEALEEIIKKGTTNFVKWPHFFSAFGKTQQYIAFVKKKL